MSASLAQEAGLVHLVRPSAKTCREPERPGLLVGAAQLGKGGREPDQPGVVAGRDGGGPFDMAVAIGLSRAACPLRLMRSSAAGWLASTVAQQRR